MRVDFYHLQTTTLDKVVPVLAERVAGTGKRLLIKTMAEQAAHLDSLLWTYRPDSWLPHGVAGEGFESEQPVLIASDGENANRADIVMLTDGGTLDEIKGFERCLNIFDGNSAESVAAARLFWKSVVAAGFEAYYWAQNDAGKWEMKASKLPASPSNQA